MVTAVYITHNVAQTTAPPTGRAKEPAMKTTIITTPELKYQLTDPMRRRTVTFTCILHAITYCRHEGLAYSLGF